MRLLKGAPHTTPDKGAMGADRAAPARHPGGVEEREAGSWGFSNDLRPFSPAVKILLQRRASIT
jgi:hypothetical protein